MNLHTHSHKHDNKQTEDHSNVYVINMRLTRPATSLKPSYADARPSVPSPPPVLKTSKDFNGSVKDCLIAALVLSAVFKKRENRGGAILKSPSFARARPQAPQRKMTAESGGCGREGGEEDGGHNVGMMRNK